VLEILWHAASQFMQHVKNAPPVALLAAGVLLVFWTLRQEKEWAMLVWGMIALAVLALAVLHFG